MPAVEALDTDELKRLQALRLRLHRLEPSRPVRDVRAALAFIRERRIVLATGRSSLPMLAEAIAGRPIRGSWMADRAVSRIYELLKRVYKSQHVLALPLVLGKDTLVDASLGPAVQRIAGDPERRRAAGAALPPLARRLLEEVEGSGEIRMDRWRASTTQGRAARLRLERDLLATSRDLHTERGYHTAVVMPWARSKISMQYDVRSHRLAFDEAVEQVILAAVHSAVIAPEREVRRWFVFGSERLDRLLREERLRRLAAGRVAWITP